MATRFRSGEKLSSEEALQRLIDVIEMDDDIDETDKDQAVELLHQAEEYLWVMPKQICVPDDYYVRAGDIVGCLIDSIETGPSPIGHEQVEKAKKDILDIFDAVEEIIALYM